MSGCGEIPDWGCGARYMHPVLAWAVYMHVGVCRQGVYNDSEMCTVVIMQFRVCIWDFKCFSAITDLLADYLTCFL